MHESTPRTLESTCEKYKGGHLVASLDDFERLQLHGILRSLSCQLYNVSRENSELSKREQLGNLLSRDECSRRNRNRALMSQIEDRIETTSKSIILERA